MSSWSAKRRFIYGGSVLLVLAIIAGSLFWKLVYKAPTCFDGAKNGDETGVDCGGSCQNLCKSDALMPVVLWSKIFNISGDLYTAVAYIDNPNINSKNPDAQYEFNIYDANNRPITSVEGRTSIPKGKKFAVFETGIVLKNQTPKSADFKFTNFASWEKDTNPNPDISLVYSALMLASTSPKVTGTVINNSARTVQDMELDVLILDNSENVVAAARSFVENLIRAIPQDFVFTWPKPFDLGVEACLNSLDVDLVLDRSGSMLSESKSPPEPFTTVINTAKDFINNLDSLDQVAITSIGTNSKQESSLSQDKNIAVSAIDNIFLSTTTLEQTNITGGLVDANNELNSGRANASSKKVIILLTDGVPTEPQMSGQSNYPISSAQNMSDLIKQSGTAVYTIGLGKAVNEDFLRSISSDNNHYFFAPNKGDLSSIYKKIGTALCPKKPNVVVVLFKEL